MVRARQEEMFCILLYTRTNVKPKNFSIVFV
jgi:hypothetical protein